MAPTCIVLKALAGEASLLAATHTVSSTRFGVAEIDLSLTVVSSEACRTPASQPRDGVDGSEEDGVGRDKWSQAVKLQYRHTLHVVLARLAEADVVIKRENFLGGDLSQKAPVQIQPFLELLRTEKLPRLHASQQPAASKASRAMMGLPKHRHGHRQGDVENGNTNICIILDVEDNNILRSSRQDLSHAVQELSEQQGQEVLLRGVGQA